MTDQSTLKAFEHIQEDIKDLREVQARVKNTEAEREALRTALLGRYVTISKGVQKGKVGKIAGFTEDYLLVDVKIPGPLTTVYPTFSYLPSEIELREDSW